ncbi:Crossover junction endonuclease mus81 [Mortierella sp. GBA43]|nr:Crossover junction endonuclease mus81 [Mortierella sp. GBA43]
MAECGNPLYLEWLGEWMEEARDTRCTQVYYAYRKAYESMAKYPARLDHPLEAINLTGIGEKMASKLEKRWIEYCKDNDIPMPPRPNARRARGKGEEPLDGEEPQPKKARPKVQRRYVPKYRSGSYAILLALLDAKLAGGVAALTKTDIQSRGQVYCDVSLTFAEYGSFYSGWNSIKTLVARNLVYQNGSLYYLTPEGNETAELLRRVDANGPQEGSGAASTSASVTTPVSIEQDDWELEAWDVPEPPGPANHHTASTEQRTSSATSSSTNTNTSTNANSKTDTAWQSLDDGDNGEFDSWDLPQTKSESSSSNFRTAISGYSWSAPSTATPSNGASSSSAIISSSTTTSSLAASSSSALSSSTSVSSAPLIGSNRDQPVNILSDSEDEKDDIVPSNLSLSEKPRVIEVTRESLAMSSKSSTTPASGLKRAPSHYMLPIRSKHEAVDIDSAADPVTAMASTSTSTSTSTPTINIAMNSAAPLGSPPFSPSIGAASEEKSNLRTFSSKRTSSLLGLSGARPILSNHDPFPHLRSSSFRFQAAPSDPSTLGNIEDLTKFQSVIFHPGTFDIHLVLDVREVRTLGDRDYIGDKLKERGVNVLKRTLDVGDVIWVAKLKTPTVTGMDELVLDYIVERKRMDDFVSSVKDGRYTEQKSEALYGIPDHVIDRKTYLDLQDQLKDKYPDRGYLTSYRAFGLLNSKSDTLVVKDVFVKMLMTIRGIGVEKAAEIARLYGTPRALFSALEEAENRAPHLLARVSSGNISKRKIGSSLSSKVATIWYSDKYADAYP